MTLSTLQTLAVSSASAAHLAFIATGTDLFRSFQQSVSGDTVADIEPKLTECNAIIAQTVDGSDLLTREFATFVNSLRSAHSNFGADIGQPGKRNLVLRLAADAYTRLTTNARAHLVREIEAQAFEPMAQAA